eukprot:566453-Amphidinium_carterae.1
MIGFKAVSSTLSFPVSQRLDVRTGTQTIDGFWSQLGSATKRSKHGLEAIVQSVSETLCQLHTRR